MSQSIQANAPQCVIGSTTYAAVAITDVISGAYFIGLYEKSPDPNIGWIMRTLVTPAYANAGEFVADVRAKGGIVKYCVLLKDAFNAATVKYFGGLNPVPSGEPTTDSECLVAVQTAFGKMILVNVNGIPTLQ